jgi:hypothetical protein
MTIVLVLALMMVAYFIPEDRRLRVMAERDIAAFRKRRCRGLARLRTPRAPGGGLGAVAGGLVLAAVFLIVTKPGL